MPPYFTEFPIRFNDIDAAGIVYFPRLLHFCHCALEDFVTARSPRSYRQYVQDGIAFPVTHVQGRFFERVHYRDRLRVSVLCEEIRAHAFRIRYELSVVPNEGKGEPKPASRIVLVHAVTLLTNFALQPVPDDLRATLETVLEATAPSGSSRAS